MISCREGARAGEGCRVRAAGGAAVTGTARPGPGPAQPRCSGQQKPGKPDRHNSNNNTNSTKVTVTAIIRKIYQKQEATIEEVAISAPALHRWAPITHSRGRGWSCHTHLQQKRQFLVCVPVTNMRFLKHLFSPIKRLQGFVCTGCRAGHQHG